MNSNRLDAKDLERSSVASIEDVIDKFLYADFY
jgi:hypothetical protein